MIEDRHKYHEELQMREEMNRQRIANEKVKQREQITRSMNEKYMQNKLVTQQIKEQKNRIRQSIDNSKMQYLEEK